MNKTNTTLSVLAMVLSAVALFATLSGIQGAETIREVVKEKVGAVSTPDMQSPYFSYGGVRHWGARTTNLQQATTTICALQAPAATSSLRFASIKLTVSSTTASNVNFGTGLTPYAISSTLGGQAVGANAMGDVVATSTVTMSPNHYFVVVMSGGSGTFSPTGTCEATWVEL